MPDFDEAMNVVTEILEVPTGSVQATDDLEEIGWDSLSDLTFISIADERYGITVDPRELAKHETPSDLAALLGVSA